MSLIKRYERNLLNQGQSVIAPTVQVVQPKPPTPISHGENDPPIGVISLVLNPDVNKTCSSCKRRPATVAIVYWWNYVSKAKYYFCEIDSWCHTVALRNIEHRSKQSAATKKPVQLAEQPKKP